jgi:hypothetical protein
MKERKRSMEQHGWYEYGEDPPSITNVLTGQRLTLTSVSLEAETAKLTCQYQDPDISHRIALLLRQAPHAVSIQLDYRWVFGSAANHGHWRRLDDFLTDALLFWPPCSGDAVYANLHVLGGWRGGSWERDWPREFSLRRGATSASGAPAAPCFLPLELPPPPRWRYVDADKPAFRAELAFKDGQPIGFQGVVPCLEREDQQSYLFPSHLEQELNRGEDLMGLPWYTYVDEDVFFTFRSHPFRRLELSSGWQFGQRQGNALPLKSATLPYATWKKALTAICDAWPMWPTPPRPLLTDPAEWPHGLAASAPLGAYGPDVFGGHGAGLVNHEFKLHFPKKRF